MSSKALLLGRNGGDLQWCYRDDADGLGECDVRKLRDALARHGYEPIVIGAAESRGGIIDCLIRTARQCAGGETLVFYFSGHAKFLRKGDLGLVLGSSGGRSDTLSAGHVIDILLDESPASSKLLVLDCCHAGEAASPWQLTVNDNLRILAAADPYHAAKEHPQVGGLFTHCLCQALTEQRYWVCGDFGVIEPDGRIWSDRLSRWLRPEVERLARNLGLDVAKPVEYGGSDLQRVCIAQVDPQDRPRPQSARFHRDELESLLTRPGADLPRLRGLFHTLLDKIDPPYRHARPADGCDIPALIDYLAAMSIRSDANIPAALFEFALLASREIQDGKPIADWVDARVAEHVQSGALTAEQAAAVGHSAGIPVRDAPAHLLLVPGSPEGNGRFAAGGAWLAEPGRPVPLCVDQPDGLIDRAGIGALAGRALAHQGVDGLVQRQGRLILELFLPGQLLTADLDELLPAPAAGDTPIHYHHPLVLRTWERVAPPPGRRWFNGWTAAWGRCQGCREAAQAPCGAIGLVNDPARERDYAGRLRQGQCLFVWLAPVGQDPAAAGQAHPAPHPDLSRALDQGVSLLLWSDESIAHLFPDSRPDPATADRPLDAWMDRVWQLRQEAWARSDETNPGRAHTGRLHLLWDDPGRRPPPLESAAHAPLAQSPYDLFST